MSNSSERINLKIGNKYRIIEKATNNDMGIYTYYDVNESRAGRDGIHMFRNTTNDTITVYSRNILALFNNNDNVEYIIQDIISPEQIDADPCEYKILYDDLKKYSGTTINLDNDCNICYSHLIMASENPVALECGHAFHQNCICTWFISKDTCPNCRHQSKKILKILEKEEFLKLKTELTQKLLVPEKGYGMMMLGDDERGGAKQKSKKRSKKRSKKSRKTKRRRHTRR